MAPVRVGIKPFVYQGIAGWRVRWYDGEKYRHYFVQSRETAKVVRERLKAGKAVGSRWAVAC